mmetsp:Transcript_31718/g.89123  ORF Transcript_31718/g.89123 Transcript_31718/m.89123 type:complete len:327 (-) Transcript_31718:2-982(-)
MALLGATATRRRCLGPLLAEHAADLLLHIAALDDVGGRGSLRLIPMQEVPAKLPQLLRVVGRHLRHGTPCDLLHKGLDVLCIERHPQGCHLVDHTPQRPDVRAERIGLLLADLGAQVVGCADGRASKGSSVLEHLGDAKVAHSKPVRRGQEQILGLEVPVQYMFVVHVLEGQRSLREPPQDRPLGEGLAGLPGAADPLVEVTTVGEVHDDGEYLVLGEAFAVAHDVGVLQRRKHPHFIDGIPPLLAVHRAHVDGLHDIELALRILHKDRLAIASLANVLDLGVTMACTECCPSLLHLLHSGGGRCGGYRIHHQRGLRVHKSGPRPA